MHTSILTHPPGGREYFVLHRRTLFCSHRPKTSQRRPKIFYRQLLPVRQCVCQSSMCAKYLSRKLEKCIDSVENQRVARHGVLRCADYQCQCETFFPLGGFSVPLLC